MERTSSSESSCRPFVGPIRFLVEIKPVAVVVSYGPLLIIAKAMGMAGWDTRVVHVPPPLGRGKYGKARHRGDK